MSEDDGELERLLEKARNHTLTEEEIRAQRESWVRGEMGIGSDRDEAMARTPVQTCNGCKRSLPITEFDQYATARTLRTRCRPCHASLEDMRRRQAEARQRGEKICAKCGQAKPIGEYQIHKAGNIGSYCRQCKRRAGAERYQRIQAAAATAHHPRRHPTWAEYTAELHQALDTATFAPEERRTRRAWMDALAQLQKRTKP